MLLATATLRLPVIKITLEIVTEISNYFFYAKGRHVTRTQKSLNY